MNDCVNWVSEAPNLLRNVGVEWGIAWLKACGDNRANTVYPITALYKVRACPKISTLDFEYMFVFNKHGHFKI